MAKYKLGSTLAFLALVVAPVTLFVTNTQRQATRTLGLVSATHPSEARSLGLVSVGQSGGCQPGSAIGYLANGTSRAEAAVGEGGYAGTTTMSIAGGATVLALPLSSDWTGSQGGSATPPSPLVANGATVSVPASPSPPAIPGVLAMQPVVAPSPVAALRSCDPSLADNANDQGLAADALSGLRTAGYISASQATNTSSDNFLVAADPLDTSDVVVVVNVPTGTSVPFPGGLPGTGYVPTVAYGAILSQAGQVVGVGKVPW